MTKKMSLQQFQNSISSNRNTNTNGANSGSGPSNLAAIQKQQQKQQQQSQQHQQQSQNSKQEHQPSLKPHPAAVKAALEAEKRRLETDQDGEQDSCHICTDPISWYAVGECNHRICHLCSLRLRALLKDQSCSICKVRSYVCKSWKRILYYLFLYIVRYQKLTLSSRV